MPVPAPTLRRLVLMAALFVPGVLHAQTASVPFDGESRLWLTGASNVRAFTCRARAFEGAIEMPEESELFEALAAQAIEAARLHVAVAALDCGIGLMNRHLRHALHAGRAPAIAFRLQAFHAGGGDGRFTAEGWLDIAGTERPVVLAGEVQRDVTGRVHFHGTHRVRLSDYGVTPPARFLGALRVRDAVTVHFDLVLDPDGAG